MTTATEPSLVPEPGSLLAAYPTRSSVFDEMRDAAGVVRPQWGPLLRGLEHLRADGLRERGES